MGARHIKKSRHFVVFMKIGNKTMGLQVFVTMRLWIRSPCNTVTPKPFVILGTG